MRIAPLITALAAGAALLAVPATAKDGVRATLDEPVRMSPPAGRMMTVKWHLSDGEGNPFGAGGIYLRVHRCGRSPMRVNSTERSSSSYSARFRVPKGMRKLTVGLEGWRTAAGKTERAD